MTETPACRPNLRVGQMPGKIFTGNPIFEFLRGRLEQVEHRSIDPVLAKPRERNSRAIQVEWRNARN